jgi:hypothetical protein
MRRAVDGNKGGRVRRGWKGLAYQAVGERLGDADGEVAADGRVPTFELRGGEIDGLVLRATAYDLIAGRVVAFDHDLLDFAQMTTIVFALDLALAIHEDAEALGFDLVRDAVGHCDCRGVGPRGELEGEDGVVFDLVDEGNGVFEVGVGLAGEADDHVAGDGDVALGGVDPAHALEVPVAGVLAGHGLENGGGAGLDREMDVVAEGGGGVDGLDDVAGEVAGVRGGEADAADAWEFTNGDEEFGERHAARGVAVGVDVLAEELDLGEAEVDHLAGFDEDGGGGAGALFPAGVGDNAVGAELVAALDDGDVSAVRVGTGGEVGLEGEVGLAVVEAGDAGFASFEAGEHVGQVAVGGGARDQRDVGGLLEDALAFLLGYAAEDGELFAFALETLVLVEAVEDLLLGLVADGAGVVEDQAGVGLVLDAGVALLLERADDFFGVMGVHLAAEGFDIEGLAHICSIAAGDVFERSFTYAIGLMCRLVPVRRVRGLRGEIVRID